MIIIAIDNSVSENVHDPENPYRSVHCFAKLLLTPVNSPRLSCQPSPKNPSFRTCMSWIHRNTKRRTVRNQIDTLHCPHKVSMKSLGANLHLLIHRVRLNPQEHYPHKNQAANPPERKESFRNAPVVTKCPDSRWLTVPVIPLILTPDVVSIVIDPSTKSDSAHL